MSEIKVSVVIPVYKVEPYLRRCVDSVLAQTLPELEIILVDDGSPDNCPAICDEYAARDSRIRVIHKENGGLASARNAGLREVYGAYVFFLDSDDWLEPDGMELLYNKAEETQVDFVKYRAFRTGWPGLPENAPCRVEEIRELEEGLYTRERIIQDIYPRLLATNQLTMGAVVGAWGAIYKTAFLRKYELAFYEEVKFSEDLIFSARVVKNADSFYFIDAPCVYHYFYNPNSISKSFRAGRWDSCRKTIQLCTEEFENDLEYDFSDELYYLKWFCILLSVNERKYLKSYREKVNYLKVLLDDSKIRGIPLILKKFDVGRRQKGLMWLVKHRCVRILSLV